MAEAWQPSDPYGKIQSEGGSNTWGDWGLVVGGALAGMAGDQGAALRALGDEQDEQTRISKGTSYLGQAIQTAFGQLEEDANGNLSDNAKANISSTVTDPNFWTLSSLTLKGLQAAPSIAAVAVPAAFLSSTGLGAAYVAAAGGEMSAAAVVDELYKMTDAMPDARLQAEVPVYKQLRHDGLDEESARREYNQLLIGLKPVYAAGIGAIANSIGVGGQVARGLSGKAGSVLAGEGAGLAKRAGVGAAEGGISEAVQSGTEDLLVQQGGVEANQQEAIDVERLANTAATGLVIGGALGTAAGAAFGGHGPAKIEGDEPVVSTPVPEAQPGYTAAEGAPPPPSASGAEATPGVPLSDTDPYAGMTYKEKRAALAQAAFENPEAVGAPRVVEPTVQTVNPAGMDASHAAALEATTSPAVPEAALAPADPSVGVPSPVTSEGNTPTQEPNVASLVPEAAPAGEVVSPAEPAGAVPPVNPENNAVVAPEAVTPTETTEASPAPALAQPTPTGPRILEDLKAPKVPSFDEAVDRNMAGMRQEEIAAAKAEQGPQGSKLSKAEIAERKTANDNASGIFLAHPPAPGEALIASKKPSDQVGARAVIKARVAAMVSAAQDAGLKLPEKYKTGVNAGYSPEVMMLMEARRLHGLGDNAKKADFDRFIRRENDVRSGAADMAIAERRQEGDQAKRVKQDDSTVSYEEVNEPTARDEDFNEITDDDRGEGGDTRADEGTITNPETALAVKQREEREMGITKADREAAKRKAPVVSKEEIPARVQEAVNAALANVGKERKAPIVEKKRAPKIAAIKERLNANAKEPAAPDNSVKARIERARSETDTNPTEARKEVGNYSKGKVSIHGNEISIETPKGSRRTGVNDSGRPWHVDMPVDYGYLNGTKGADGEPIDVFVGPEHDASYVYIIDQSDADTGAFDEHKVMMGFKSDANAERAYMKSFSDGRGDERLESLTKMTIEEFKKWKDTAPQGRAGADASDVFEAKSAMVGDRIVTSRGNRLPEVAPGWVREPVGGTIVKPVSSRKGREVLTDLKTDHLAPVPKAIAKLMMDRLTKLVGDVDIHFVEHDDMVDVVGLEGALGSHSTKDGYNDVIFINERQSLEQQSHTILHEMVHAATVRAVVSDPRFKADIQRMMARLEEEVPFLSDEDAHSTVYGLTDPREFVAEVLSNPDLQRVLSGINISDADTLRFGLSGGDIRSAFDFIMARIRRALGLPVGTRTLLEAAIRVSDRNMRPLYEPTAGKAQRAFLKNGNTSALVGDWVTKAEEALKRRDLAPQRGMPRALWFRTLDSIERTADRYFGKDNPIRRIVAAMESQRVQARKEVEGALKLAQPISQLQNKYKGKVWDDFATFIRDETDANVYADRALADNKHLSSRDAWAKARHPELQKAFNALPDDLKAARKQMHDYYRTQQDRLAVKTIRNRIVTLFDTPDADGLAQRIHEGKATDADKTLMGDAYDAIKQAGTLAKIEGPYVPLMRRGDFVVKGSYDITPPQGAKALDESTFEFDNQAAADKFAETQGPHTVVDKYFVDKNTGERNVTSQGKTVRVTENDFDAVPRWRASVQDRHMEMFDTMADARARVAELRKQGINADDAVPREYQGAGIQLDALSTHVRKMIDTLDRRAEARGLTDEQRLELRKTLAESSMNLMGATRIQSRNIARRNVAGASIDHVRNMVDYGHSMGNQIAKLDNRPKIDSALEDAKQYIKDNGSDGLAAGRQAIFNEVVKRVTDRNPMDETKGMTAGANRLLAASFIDKLASPSYSVVNALQPSMTTTPFLAARYGIGRAVREMGRAYNEVGSISSITEGIKQTARNVAGGRATIDPLATIMGRVKDKGAIQMLEILRDRGIIGGEQGLEISDTLKKSNSRVLGKLDTGLSYAENIARHLPQVVEDINRSVSALAAYRLEMQRSGDQARAVQFAHDTVNRTQFNYSHTNTAPWMRHPLARIAFQFKKYGVGMYQLLGEQMGIAIRNDNPGDRAAAIRTLSYTIAMHGLMAGAMGLPVEPLKMAVMAANAVGITEWSWKDVEAAEREALVDLFGQGAGEVIARGVPRALGVDLSGRVGLDSLLGPFGEPRSNEPTDTKAFLWDNLAGAPVGLLGDWAVGASHLMAGEFERAAEKLIPLKVVSDSLKAYRTMTEGSVSLASGKQVMSPYSAGEAVTRALGFAPAREQESFERSGIYYRRQQAQEDARTDFQKEWVAATPAAKGRIWREVIKWNKSVAPEARLTIGDMRSYQKRLERDKKETVEGIRAKKREETLLKNVDKNYDFLP